MDWYTGKQAFASLMIIGTVFSYYWFFKCNSKLKLSKVAFITIPLILLFWGFISTRYFLPFIEAFGTVSLLSVTGMRLYGSLFFDWIAVYAIAKFLKVNYRALFDVWTISMVAYLAIGRINCFITGCCYGKPIFGTEWTWPIREIEIIANIGFLIYYAPRTLKDETNGELYPLYMIFYGAIRFVLEWFRVEGIPFGPFHLAHVWSILSIMIGYSIYATINCKKKLPIGERKGRK